MIDAELSQPLKKDPVVEYEIPKRIFTADPTANKDSLTQDMNQVSVLTQLWDFA